jgi:hypothetical protein
MLRCKASYLKPPEPPQPEAYRYYDYNYEEPEEDEDEEIGEVHIPIMIFILGFITLALVHPLE